MSQLPAGAAIVKFDAAPGDIFLLPGPIHILGLASSLTLDGLEALGSAPGDFGPQQAVFARAERSAPSVAYRWRAAKPAKDTAWLWSPPNHSLNRASSELASRMRQLTNGMDRDDAEAAVLRHVAGVFRYGHSVKRFTDGTEAVPALSCSLTEGSCVDIHTYAVAALRSVGIDAAYVAGVFWPAGESTVDDMHCWVVSCINEIRAWDISHDVAANRTPQVDRPALPGNRLPFSVGRGQRFAWSGRNIEISHFALPHRLSNFGAIEIPAQLTRLP